MILLLQRNLLYFHHPALVVDYFGKFCSLKVFFGNIIEQIWRLVVKPSTILYCKYWGGDLLILVGYIEDVCISWSQTYNTTKLRSVLVTIHNLCMLLAHHYFTFDSNFLKFYILLCICSFHTKWKIWNTTLLLLFNTWLKNIRSNQWLIGRRLVGIKIRENEVSAT